MVSESSNQPGWQQVPFNTNYYSYFITVGFGQSTNGLNFGNTTNIGPKAVSIKGSVTNNGNNLSISWVDPSSTLQTAQHC